MKKFIPLSLLLCVFVISLLACSPSGADSTTAVTTTVGFSIEEYKAAIGESRSAIYKTSIYLANAGEYVYNYCEALERLGDSGDPNQKAVEAAFKWLAENSDGTRKSVDAEYETVRQQYKKITLIEPVGNEAEKLYGYYSEMYDGYIELYNLVTKPSCSLSDYLDTYNDCVNAITGADEDLSLFLD